MHDVDQPAYSLPTPRLRWFQRLVQFIRDRKERRLRRRIESIKDRIAYLDDPMRFEVMRIFGDTALEGGMTWAVEAIMEKMQAERWELDRLRAQLPRLEKKLNACGSGDGEHKT